MYSLCRAGTPAVDTDINEDIDGFASVAKDMSELNDMLKVAHSKPSKRTLASAAPSGLSFTSRKAGSSQHQFEVISPARPAFTGLDSVASRRRASFSRVPIGTETSNAASSSLAPVSKGVLHAL